MDNVGQLFTKAETAKRLRISCATLDRRITDGLISYYKVGWQILFDNQQIEAYLSSCKNGSRGRRTQENASAIAV